MIKLHTLGRLSLTGPDGHEILSVLAQPKRVAVLTYLALATPRGFHRRDTLLGLFWPELDQEHARGALNQALTFLRRSLGDAIETRGGGEVGLQAEDCWCDAVVFERLLDAERASEALELYQGDLLAGFFIGDAPEFEHWLDRERERLRRRATEAAWALADESEAVGKGPDAKRWARRAATLAPDDEGVFRRLIALLDRVGDRAQAVIAYEAFERRLSEEYELLPSPETQELIDGIRTRVESSPQFVAPPPPPRVKPDDAVEDARASTKVPHRRSFVPSVRMAAAAVIVLWISAVVMRSLTTPGYALDDTPPTYWPTALASPGGERMVYVSEERGRPQLWVRSFESEGGRPLVGTDYATGPFWSPYGLFIGFFADGRLKTIDVDSGAIEVLATTLSGTGGSWNAKGVILYTGTVGSLVSAHATGGSDWPAVLRRRSGQTGLRAPHFLPDGRHFLYLATGVDAGLYVSVLEGAEIEIRRTNPDHGGRLVERRRRAWLQHLESTREVERLVDSDSGGVYHPSGHLLYVRGDTLYAHGFDLDQMSLTGEELMVTDESISWTTWRTP